MASPARWDPLRYLRFETERTLPSRDLAARVEIDAPRQIVDLGCGPGNSTAVLRARWPAADCTGVDLSAEMLEVARRSDPGVRWVQQDLRTWVADGPVDLIFSNAALQWVRDHGTVLPRLLRMLSPGGALAVQMPANTDEPYQRAVRELRQRPPWNGFPDGPAFQVGSSEFYYDLLAPEASRIDLWDTSYVHVLSGAEEIAEWTRGTGLSPWLAELPGEAERNRFLEEYRAKLEIAYPRRPDGRVLFPFHRRFLVAYRRPTGPKTG